MILLHPHKANSPITFTFFPIVTLDRLVQSEKAALPTEVTLSDIVILYTWVALFKIYSGTVVPPKTTFEILVEAKMELDGETSEL